MTIEKILVIEHDRLSRDFLKDLLSKKKIDVSTAEDEEKSLNLLKAMTFDMVIAEIDRSAIGRFLCIIRDLSPSTIVTLTGTANTLEIDGADSSYQGVDHYLIKPFSEENLDELINKVNKKSSLKKAKMPERKAEANQLHIIAESPVMKLLLTDVKRIAKSQASVFISGESGTGKEVIAQAIHFFSERSHKPYVRVNCAAMPETLIESEFFGHEKGAFTGANSKRTGRFEIAHEGTLLLDEVTEIPPTLQAKLLRVVQEQEFERVGSSKPIKVDVRLISTSNRDLREAIANKILREDLYYRLNVVPIQLLPLRERKEDIIPLAEYFLEKACLNNKKQLKSLAHESKGILLTYSWPGNIRELANVVERAVVLDSSSKNYIGVNL